MRSLRFPTSALAILLALATASPARATFHLWEITKILTSHDGDPAVQAVEMRAIASGENLVSTASLVVYDVNGVAGATLGTFAADLPAAGAVTGAHILFATMKFKQRFGITPDLQISAGLLPTNGQIAFQKPGCIVNAVAYGGVVTPIGGNTTSAPPLPSGSAALLERVIDNAVFPSCPQGDDANAKFRLRTATPSDPATFTNYSNVSVNVSSTVTGVEGAPTPIAAPRAYPNPFRGSIRVEAGAAGRVAVYDVQGALVRVLMDGGAVGPSFRGEWDGRDRFGKAVPAGIYFISFGDHPSDVRRVAVLR